MLIINAGSMGIKTTAHPPEYDTVLGILRVDVFFIDEAIKIIAYPLEYDAGLGILQAGVIFIGPLRTRWSMTPCPESCRPALFSPASGW